MCFPPQYVDSYRHIRALVILCSGARCPPLFSFLAGIMKQFTKKGHSVRINLF